MGRCSEEEHIVCEILEADIGQYSLHRQYLLDPNNVESLAHIDISFDHLPRLSRDRQDILPGPLWLVLIAILASRTLMGRPEWEMESDGNKDSDA